MHLADGIVTSVPLLAAANLAGAAALAVALRGVRDAEPRARAWTGTLAAFVLAAQYVNLPLAPGASAHVIGAGLLALTLGPARAVLALAAVLIAQALLLADGGVTVLGLNLLTIAVVPVLSMRLAAWAIRSRSVAAVVGTTFGNLLGAAILSAFLVLGAAAPAGPTFAWLVGVQALAGVLEGALTAAALGHLARVAPGLVRDARARGQSAHAPAPKAELRRGLTWAAVALGIAVALLPFASGTPDALERVVAGMRWAP